VEYHLAQSVVYCSRTLHQSQDRDMGSRVVGCADAACFASASASSFPCMLVCPGTQCMVMVVAWARRVCAMSLMFHAVSCPRPRVLIGWRIGMQWWSAIAVVALVTINEPPLVHFTVQHSFLVMSGSRASCPHPCPAKPSHPHRCSAKSLP
jgi:hypothetical protein